MLTLNCRTPITIVAIASEVNCNAAIVVGDLLRDKEGTGSLWFEFEQLSSPDQAHLYRPSIVLL